MSYEIQKEFFCENCKKCGTRPVIDQKKKVWTVKCPNVNCKNEVADNFINVDKWNSLNMQFEVGKIQPDNLKYTG